MTTNNNEGFRFEDIIVDQIYDEKDDKGNLYKRITDLAGQSWKIKSGQDGRIKAKWNLLIHAKGLRLTIGRYKDYDYVADLESLQNLADIETARKRQQQQRDLKNEGIAESVSINNLTLLMNNNKSIPEDLVNAYWGYHRKALRNYVEINK